jgi:RNA polymerase sigma-70 factor (ECF subfamily)
MRHQQKRATGDVVTGHCPAEAGHYVRLVTATLAARSYDMDRQSELELVGRVRDGDAAAFDAVYAIFNARLFGFLARLTRNRHEAEDLAEETWLRFVANAARLSADTRLGPWLFTVARNVHVSYCRSRALDDMRTPEAIGLWPSVSCESPFESAAATELEQRIEAALASLPIVYREVLLLVGVEGLRPADAASVCGVSPEALRQRLKRARALLADRLEAAVPRRRYANER